MRRRLKITLESEADNGYWHALIQESYLIYSHCWGDWSHVDRTSGIILEDVIADAKDIAGINSS
jgi:hypothetical protein